MAGKNFYVAVVSTTVETANPESELKPGLDLLGPILEKYEFVNRTNDSHTLSLSRQCAGSTLLKIY